MASEPRLTLAYLEHAPAAAAGVLQRVELVDSIAFLDSVPTRLAAPVINAMIPWYGARCLEGLSTPHAALVLRHLSFNDAASLVRLTRDDDRADLFDELPALLARRLTSALRYPAHLVGAWMDPEALVLRSDHHVDDALRTLQAAGPATHVFLESAEDGRFAGAVTVQAILHLPVVGRRGTVLGALSRIALRKAISEQAYRRNTQDTSLLRHLVGALLVACSGIARLAIQPMGSSPDRRKGIVGHER
jgi:hypothetical protein